MIHHLTFAVHVSRVSSSIVQDCAIHVLPTALLVHPSMTALNALLVSITLCTLLSASTVLSVVITVLLLRFVFLVRVVTISATLLPLHNSNTLNFATNVLLLVLLAMDLLNVPLVCLSIA